MPQGKCVPSRSGEGAKADVNAVYVGEDHPDPV